VIGDFHRPSGTPQSNLAIVFPTLKRGANKRCAYGMGLGWIGAVAPTLNARDAFRMGHPALAWGLW
jgi:hypothetical protein